MEDVKSQIRNLMTEIKIKDFRKEQQNGVSRNYPNEKKVGQLEVKCSQKIPN